MRRRQGRPGNRSRAVLAARLLAAGLLSALATLAGPAAAQSAWDRYFDSFGEPRLTGTPGSYAVLLDQRRELVRGAYWIGPHTVVLFERALGTIAPAANAGEMVDRPFLPSVRLSAYLLEAARVFYTTLPPPPENREQATIEALPFALSFVGPPTPLQRTALGFRWIGSEKRDFAGQAVAAYSYEANGPLFTDGASLRDVQERQERVFVPALGLDLSAEEWERAETLIAGTGLVSSADLALEVWLKQPIDSGMRDCLETLRGSADTLAFSQGIALLEKRSEVLLPVGRNDILEYGISEYQDLEESFHVMDRFQTCIGA